MIIIMFLLTIITIPLIIIHQYEQQILGIRSTQEYMQKVKELNSRVNNLITNSSIPKRQAIKIIKTNDALDIQANVSKISALLVQIQNKINQNDIMGALHIFNNLNIFNVLICSQLWPQRQTIKNQVMRILDYISNKLQMSLKIVEYHQNTPLYTQQATIFVVFREFKQQIIEQNMAQRLKNGQYRNEYYLREIAKQLKRHPSFSHCQYTNYYCSQRTLLMVHNERTKKQTYWKIDNQIIIIDQNTPEILLNSVIELFSVNQIFQLAQDYDFDCKQLYISVQQRANLLMIKNILNYFQFIFKNKDIKWQTQIKQLIKNPQRIIEFIKKGKYRSAYIHNQVQLQRISLVLKVIDNNLRGTFWQKIKSEPLSDDKIGVIDLFPNDFRMGVYLPLMVLFLTPLANKLWELIKSTKNSKPKLRQG